MSLVYFIVTTLHLLYNISSAIIIEVELALQLLIKGYSNLIDNKYLTCMGCNIRIQRFYA